MAGKWKREPPRFQVGACVAVVLAMSHLLNFYRGQAADSEGRALANILAWDDDAFEEVHDFIQWLFPLPEPSQFNPHAPLLTRDDIAAFHTETALQAALRQSFERFLAFVGLMVSEDGGVAEAGNFADRVSVVWAVANHNWLRISRVLQSLRLLGLRAEADALFRWLAVEHSRRRFPIDERTFRYWSAAAAR